MAMDTLVDSLASYRPRPMWARGYVGPFALLYLAWFYLWLFVYGTEEYWEIGCIFTALIILVQILTVLFCHWFVAINCLMTCVYVADAKQSSLIRVNPTPNNGWAELVPLQRRKLKTGTVKLWFEFQKVHYTYDEERKSFRTVEMDTNVPMRVFQEAKGLETEDAITEAQQHLGDNRMEMVVPTFMDLFLERATAPFFVFQVFCVGLWCLEDMWYYSLFTLMMLITFEATLVKQQLKNMSDIRNMGNKPYLINVYRCRRWNRIKSDELLPGDVISLCRSDEQSVPCDLLLLRGPCIVDESMLTGESVPQMKEAIEDVDRTRFFDMENDSRLHVINGGTKVVQNSAPGRQEAGLKAPDGGCLCLVLRTGFNTNQGRLLRTIMFGVKRVTANNLETLCFILFLLIFAIAASGYLWMKGTEDESTEDESRNKYKLFLECTLILTSVIPPELPIELSLAVNNSLLALQKLGVFCTEPFRIPFAGKVDICCFDKTGTLTTDNLVVEGVAGTMGRPVDENLVSVRNATDAMAETIQVLVTCHSLVRFDDDLVGDPLEKACLAWADWNLTKNDTVIPRKSKALPLKLFHRFHFSSAMKRMTVIAGYLLPGTSETHHMVTLKGAPEIVINMLETVPEDYESTYRQLTRQGARVLALAIKDLGCLSHQEIRDVKRESLEKGLRFVGFVVISCPLKKDSKEMIKEIVESSHRVVMITGDNPLTACHVARVLRFVKRGAVVLVLDQNPDRDWRWASVDEDLSMDLIPSNWRTFVGKYELCLTGSAFAHLLDNHYDFLKEIIVHVRVFARMAPKQKERIINELKQLGKVTLMCGDGTNDVGALKHSHVGVALLSHPFDATKQSTESTPSTVNGAQIEAKSSASAGNMAVQKKPASSGRRTDAPIGARMASRPGAQTSQLAKRLENMQRQMEEEEKAQIVRLGDASIAAPFTSKYTSIQSICHVIKQGRCTLVTTLQMFKILALNALVLAYSQSVLYLDGIKFSDTQATIQGLLLAACFLFISRSRPLQSLARQRPIPNIFNAYTLLTVTGQFVIHFSCLLFLVREAKIIEPKEDKVDLEAEFKPNLLNSTVYIMAMALQVSTFAVNYRGRPFMESLWENKAMLYSLLFSGCAVFTLAAGLSPEMTEKFELVHLPSEFRNTLVKAVSFDLAACFTIDRSLNFLLGDMRA